LPRDFINLRFIGRTTSPWSIARRIYSDYIYCQDFLWGRGVRGPVLNYLLKAYCGRTGILPCEGCVKKAECPFYNLYGADREGEDKDSPRLVVTSLRFEGKPAGKPRQPLISRSELTNGVALGPVFVEYIPVNTTFRFEAILTSDAVKFIDEFKEAVRATLALSGWGGRCSRGYGRGVVVQLEELDFDNWASSIEECVKPLVGSQEVYLEIHPILILERYEGEGVYGSILEEGFTRKLRSSIEERYWQFFRVNARLRGIEAVSGRCQQMTFRSWSRRDSREKHFTGIAGTLKVRFKEPLTAEEAMLLGVARYGIGRYKNQGFGSLHPVVGEV
jgi:hypothetical protein